MPYQTLFVRKARHFIPPEASAPAAELQSIAREARDLSDQLKRIGARLESSWEGRARMRFLGDFEGLPPAGKSVAAWFEDQARRVGSITVTMWETVPETVWVPDS